MTIFPDDYFLYASLSGSLIDLTSDAIKNDISGEWGLSSEEAKNRLADTGFMNFTLNNIDGKYTPGGINCLAGWKKGIEIYWLIYFEGESYKRFKGTIGSLKPNDEDFTMDVEILDWMDYSNKYPLITPSTLINQRADQGLNTVLAGMPIQPDSTYFDAGNETFSVIFNSTDPKTKAYTEFQKLTISEPGYLYLQKDKINGEKLVFENNLHRYGLTYLDVIPKSFNEQSRVLNSNGGHVKNSTGGNIVLRQYQDVVFDNDMNDIKFEYGQGMINHMTATANPKTYDSGSVVLFSLSEPVFIGSGQTVTFYGSYVNSSGISCNALTSSMIQPVATTDYLLNTLSDGTGTNLTANLSGSAVYGSNQVKFTYSNGSPYSAYITKMIARGVGIYDLSPIDALEESQTSINEHGYQDESIDMAYQTDLLVGRSLIASIVELEKKPRKQITEVSFVANTSNFLMLAFLNIDIGSLIHLKDDRYGVDGYFYVQKIMFKISMGGIIVFSLKLRKAFSLLLGLSMVACTFHASSTDAVCYGNLPQLVDLPDMTFSAWVNPTGYGKQAIMAGWVDGSGGFAIYLGGGTYVANGVIQIVRYHTGGGGQWVTSTVIPLDQWTHIAISIDDTTANPKIYINGVLDSTTTVLIVPAISYNGTPIGPVGSINGMDFCVGNIHGQSPTTQFAFPFIGSIKDSRVYDRILTSDEIANLYNGSNVTEGLVFQGNCIRTDEISDYQGVTLNTETKLLDNIFGAIGTPHGSPICSIP